MEDLFGRIEREARSFWERLRTTPIKILLQDEARIALQIKAITDLARTAGGKIEADVEKMERDVLRLIRGEMSLAEMNRMMQHTLKVEQDTKEL